jgi:hypothetical protein
MSEHKQKEERFVALEERVGRLEEIFDTNSSVFSTSLEYAEMCIQALQRAMDDMLLDALKTVEVDGVRKVDFKHYLQQALEFRLAADKDKQPIVKAPQETPAFEFGG